VSRGVVVQEQDPLGNNPLSSRLRTNSSRHSYNWTDPENRVGDQDTGSPDRPVSSRLQVTGESGRCRARTRPTW